jgi:hypothetical protein
LLSHKVACVGRSQARIFESWGQAQQCEIVGLPRFDGLLDRVPRVRPPGEPFTILVMTAKSPGFTTEQVQRATRSLIDLKEWLDRNPEVHGVPVRAIWRVTQCLENEVGVENTLSETTGQELADTLARVDAVITTPSTSMLEGMLQQLPVALLDYNNCPHYVPAAWRITAPTHFDQAIPELVLPPPVKMAYQKHVLRDALECGTPALPRLCQLITQMHTLSKRAVSQGQQVSFPSRLLQRPTAEPAADVIQHDWARLFPQNAAFSEHDIWRLQAEVADLRDAVTKLKDERPILKQQLSALEAGVAGPSQQIPAAPPLSDIRHAA